MPFYYMNFYPLMQPWAHAHENMPTCTVVREDNLVVGMISTAACTVFSEVVEVVGVLAMAPTTTARFTRAPHRQLLV
jgi:hypothetical protein